jgi:cyclophilin family peptidyl-prolyl cis-trans isomerase
MMHLIDKNFVKKPNKSGVLSIVNFGKDSNALQFFIHMDANWFLDGSNMVFGWLSLATRIIATNLCPR